MYLQKQTTRQTALVRRHFSLTHFPPQYTKTNQSPMTISFAVSCAALRVQTPGQAFSSGGDGNAGRSGNGRSRYPVSPKAYSPSGPA